MNPSMKISLSLFIFIYSHIVQANQAYPQVWNVLRAPKTCECFALWETKNYLPEMEIRHWYGGITRGWTCEYVCLSPDQREDRIKGLQRGGFTFTEKGDEFSCYGSVYEMKETPMRTDRWFIMDLKGVEPFSALKTPIQELKTWANQNGCQN